ncbi:MAG: DUF3823 domain-containing protein [Bacteroidales bacterium]|nr:DUF3823 domain-containing protein [Bacteroidales bacterium]MBO7640335.1 DUF3823 domain-containing protein [Bacteroidales bacterium]
MKKILYLIPLLLMATACDWFEFDNMDGYDATISGQFIDAGTNQPVLFGVPDNYGFTIYEQEGSFTPAKGTFKPTAQTWYAKTNGSYTNKLVFSGKYRIDTKTNNFYPLTEEFTIAKGDNQKNFTVTPFARVKDVNFSYDSGSQELVAKFKVEHGDAAKTNNIDVNFMIAKSRFVGQSNNNAKDATASKKAVSTGTEIELRISTKGGNNSEFQYKQPHYLRIGALATGPGVNGNKKYNYSAVYKVSEDFSKFEEVTDWD